MPLLGQDLSGALSLRVAILGPGLIGGSLAMALGRSPDTITVGVWARREAAVEEARTRLPGCLVTSSLPEVVGGADIVVLCISPAAILESGNLLLPHLSSRSVVTDAGSVKARIVNSLEPVLGGRFVGAHPMAGSEQSGILAARADLFDGAACILTPTGNSDASALRVVRDFWAGVGCRVYEMAPDLHDRVVARVSHLPHAAAAALVRAVNAGGRARLELAGSGYRDTTRPAAGPERMWREILLDNRAELIAGLSDLQGSLEELKNALSRDDGDAVEDFLRESRELRGTSSNPQS